MTHFTQVPRRCIVEFAEFRLDPKKRQFSTLDGTAVTLHSRAFDILLTLVSRPGELVTKQQLLESVWPGMVVDENNINQAISALRKAFGNNRGRDSIIKTIPSRGYCFVADVRLVEEDTPMSTLEPAPETSAPLALRSTHRRKMIALSAVCFSITVLVTVALLLPATTVRVPAATLPSALPVAPPEVSSAPGNK